MSLPAMYERVESETKDQAVDTYHSGYHSDPASMDSHLLEREPQKTSNAFARGLSKAANAIGFHKSYNLPLYIIFAGAMLGFCLARMYYFNVTGIYAKKAIPGEWYQLKSDHWRVGITMHIATCIPAGFLAIFQFIPIIRYKAILVHRINGYLVVTLLLLAIASAFMIMRRAAGGAIATQASFGLLGIMCTTSVFLAYYNVKKLQIDQHRAWMLRTWFYAGAIITERLIMILAALIVSTDGTYVDVQSCGQIASLIGMNGMANKYPECLSNSSMPASANRQITVKVNFNGTGPEQTGAALRQCFPMAMYLALIIHAAGIEIYLRLTPAESERLRVVSWRKQLEAGMPHPGSAGTTVDRWGDAPKWMPPRDAITDRK